MPKHKRKFIPKENAIKFHLVHRSQQDPLTADESAPQRVLLPAESNGKNNVEEQHKFGIFFDDEYDYLQHLKSSSEWQGEWQETIVNERPKPVKGKKVQLPSSVFASEVEENVGLLNKAAPILGPRPELDCDIVAALDDDFDFDDPENQLEDNFMELANAECSGSDLDEELEDEESDVDSEDLNEVPDLPEEFGNFETKSRFTDYSLSSSVIRRNEQLTLLDDRFEKAMEGYNESEIGALDCDEIEGTLASNDSRLLKLAENYTEESEELGEASDLKKKILELSKNSAEFEELEELVVEVPKEKWDCESILSTYSNIYNHPAKIMEPRGQRKIKVNRAGIPVNEIDGRNGPKLTAANLAALEGNSATNGPKSIISLISELSHRPKDESLEEKKERKRNIKEYRRERRIERKANTQAFTDEKIRQEKVLLNLKNNLRGIKIL